MCPPRHKTGKICVPTEVHVKRLSVFKEDFWIHVIDAIN